MPIGTFQYTFSETEENLNNLSLSGSDYRRLQKRLRAKELFVLRYLSGCDLYIIPEQFPGEKTVREALQERKVLPATGKLEHRLLTGRDSVYRFLQVAIGASPDSRGNHLLERLHESLHRLTESGQISPHFQRLFQRGIWLHEKARQETRFFQFPVHAAGALCELAGKILGSVRQAAVYVIGTDPRLPQLVKDVHRAGCRKLTFLGQEAELDKDLVLQVGGTLRTAQKFDHLPEDADILLTYPSKNHKLTPSLIQERMRKRPQAPLLIFDFAGYELPQKQLKKYPELYIYDEEAIQKVVQYNRSERQEDAQQIDRWIQEEIDAFYEWHNSEERYQFAGIIGATPQMQRIFEMISRISRTDITVLIDGESGTGKELVARAIHDLSARSQKPFKVVNCGAIPDNLLESELFGHVRGAFTGAVAPKQGLFEVANHGTVFLDEIGELPSQLQVKLLRVLQEGEIKRVGSNETTRVDVRVLAATNKELVQMVAENTFRSDLFYRLNVIQITIPPLRERPEDISLLTRHFIKKYAARLRKDVTDIAPEALQALRAYGWPGNVRELENAIERSVALAFGKTISVYDLPPNLQNVNGKALPATDLATEERPTLKEVEKNYILETLDACDWNYEQASKQLGIGRTTLWRKLREYNVIDQRSED